MVDDVKGQIGKAFIRRKELLTKRMSKDIKKRMVKCLAWPMAL